MTASVPDLETYLRQCMLCPRDCGADRRAGETGFCGQTDQARVALATRHYGEEPPFTGSGGSGTVFFSGCTLGCPFCQNRQISSGGRGRVVATAELAMIFNTLEQRGAENINIVTGTHFAPQIATALSLARTDGLTLPVLWNTSGYENDTGLDVIDGFTDVYLPDLKTLDRGIATQLFSAPDYPDAATAAILRMAARGTPVFDTDGAMKSGTIVRHLVLPGMLENTRQVLTWFREHIQGKALLSLMFQYIPTQDEGGTAPSRPVEDAEYYRAMSMLDDLGINDGFIQEMDYDSPWMPDFEAPNPFPDDHSKVVWHWKYGFVAED
jgi:putative pyruvate formate lyase activating enzyme